MKVFVTFILCWQDNYCPVKIRTITQTQGAIKAKCIVPKYTAQSGILLNLIKIEDETED